jgi:hypothetical protein
MTSDDESPTLKRSEVLNNTYLREGVIHTQSPDFFSGFGFHPVTLLAYSDPKTVLASRIQKEDDIFPVSLSPAEDGIPEKVPISRRKVLLTVFLKIFYPEVPNLYL